MVFNNSTSRRPRNRLQVAVSMDAGSKWHYFANLESGRQNFHYHYPTALSVGCKLLVVYSYMDLNIKGSKAKAGGIKLVAMDVEREYKVESVKRKSTTRSKPEAPEVEGKEATSSAATTDSKAPAVEEEEEEEVEVEDSDLVSDLLAAARAAEDSSSSAGEEEEGSDETPEDTLGLEGEGGQRPADEQEGGASDSDASPVEHYDAQHSDLLHSEEEHEEVFLEAEGKPNPSHSHRRVSL